MWIQFIDRMIPKTLLEESQDRGMARTLVCAVLCLLAGCVVLPLIASSVFSVFHYRAAGALAVLSFSALPVLWLTRSTRIAGHIPPASVTIIVCYALSFGEGIHAFSLVLVSAVPLLAGLLLGRIPAITWTSILLVVLSANGWVAWRSGDVELATLQWYTAAASLAHCAFALVFVDQRTQMELAQQRLYQQKLQSQTRQDELEKLESLGDMAGGVAHDFNNILASIVSSVEVAKMRMGDQAADFPEFEAIFIASKRASSLVQQLLHFTGRGFREIQPVVLNELVASTVDMLRLGTPHQLIVRQSESVVAQGDQLELRQAQLNLIVNATESYGESGGDVELSVGRMAHSEIDPKTVLHGAELTEERYGYIRCVDHGSGISEHVKRRIFDPFFSTKPQGAGMGLSSVLGIVRGHHGAIVMEETRGGGATITLLIPCGASEAEAEMDSSHNVTAGA